MVCLPNLFKPFLLVLAIFAATAFSSKNITIHEEKIVFGAGCFWCIESCYKELKGVIDVKPGYSGGTIENPSYEDVCSGETGHAEVARVIFDSNQVAYAKLLEVFWFVHDPTQLNRQGPDVGDQYRSGVYTINDEQMKLAKAYISKLEESKTFKNPIVTEVEAAKKFYLAEDYHQDYIEKTGRMCHVTNPWAKDTSSSH